MKVTEEFSRTVAKTEPPCPKRKASELAASTATPAAARPPDAGLGAVTVVGSVALAAVGGWLLWRGRQLPFPGRTARKLAIEETRSLGSRQYLVVASYEGQKLLLGVCPGRIDLLTPLAGPPARIPAP